MTAPASRPAYLPARVVVERVDGERDVIHAGGGYVSMQEGTGCLTVLVMAETELEHGIKYNMPTFQRVYPWHAVKLAWLEYGS